MIHSFSQGVARHVTPQQCQLLLYAILADTSTPPRPLSPMWEQGKGEVCPKSECLVVEASEGLVEQAQDGQLFWLRAPSGRPLTAPGMPQRVSDDSQHGHNVFWL